MESDETSDLGTIKKEVAMSDDAKLEKIRRMKKDELYAYACEQSIKRGIDIDSILAEDADYQEVCDFFADYIDPKLEVWFHSDFAWLSD